MIVLELIMKDKNLRRICLQGIYLSATNASNDNVQWPNAYNFLYNSKEASVTFIYQSVHNLISNTKHNEKYTYEDMQIEILRL